MAAHTIPVLAAPFFDPGTGRVDIAMPEGATLAEMVRAALPAATADDLRQARVALVSPLGSLIIPEDRWARIRPKPGVRVVIRVLPSGDKLGSILAITISIAAIASGQIWGAQLGGALGLTGATATAVGSAVIGVGVTIAGQLLVNALVPPPKPPGSPQRQDRFSITGWQNRMEPNGAVPEVLGRIRIAPPFAARSYTEIVGNWQYVRAVFCAGYGELALSDFRIGETSIADYDEVEIEVRSGLPGDLPLSLFPTQVVEESVGTELTRPFPRDDAGNIQRIPIEAQTDTGQTIIVGWRDAAPIPTPVIRTTGADAKGASIILAFPAGLVRLDNKGRPQDSDAQVIIEQRPIGATEWTHVVNLTIVAKNMEAFYRQHTWDFPSRGRWQIRLTRLSPEETNTAIQKRTVWAGLQTLRPEYPLDVTTPLALVAMRIKATHQINGSLDNINMLAERICLDWEAGSQTWIKRATRNPAALFRHVLQSAANWQPVGDAAIDLALLQDWHDFCRVKGLHYDRELTEAGSTLREVLTEIAAAGRATPRHDGLRWGVVIDRPQELIVDHISPRNAWAFSARRAYVKPPHALRVKFFDAANDYRPAERLVRWPGHTGEIVLTEELAMPGKTDASEVWREAHRRALEIIHRPDSYQVTQDGPARVATRGDLVSLSQDILDGAQVAARVRATEGTLIELDEEVEIVDGEAYGLRFRRFAEDDAIGQSIVLPVTAAPGWSRVLMAEQPGDMPMAGDLVMVGRRAKETFQMRVTGVEAAQDMASLIRMVDAAPIIDQLTDTVAIPPWSSRVGQELDPTDIAPATPRFTGVSTGVEGTETAGLIAFLIAPGSSAIPIASYRIEHRRKGTEAWTVFTIPVANGGGTISGYGQGDEVEMRATARTSSGHASAPTATLTFVVGADDAPIPEALDDSSVSITSLPGGALIQFATGADAATTAVQLYRSTSPVLDREADAAGAPVTVTPRQTHSISVGDMTRVNLLTGGDMSAAAPWTLGAGWSFGSGRATHTPGSAGWLSQAVTLRPGRWYRLGWQALVSAGTVTPQLTGGSIRHGRTVGGSGPQADRIQAVTGNERFAFSATSAFDGSIDDAFLFLETPACLDQGTHNFWLEPQNGNGVPGPVLGPFPITII